ncbi:MAG: hypothetical protein JNG89_10390 [Planctomycetaceae bacterium]|nr:hypothetical protein [Planctomycetaceae bacterium]
MPVEDILKIAFGVVVIGVIVVIKLLLRSVAEKDAKILREGQTLFTPIVRAESALSSPGEKEGPAYVLVCFDDDTPELRRRLLQFAEFLNQLAEREVNELIKLVRPGSAAEIPNKLTEELTVYFASVWVDREHLPGGVLTRKFLMCKAMPEKPGGLVMMPEQD